MAGLLGRLSAPVGEVGVHGRRRTTCSSAPVAQPRHRRAWAPRADEPKQALAAPAALGETSTWAPQTRELSGRPAAAGQEIWLHPCSSCPGACFGARKGGGEGA